MKTFPLWMPSELLTEQNLFSLVASSEKSANHNLFDMIVFAIHIYDITITNQHEARWKFCLKNNHCCNCDNHISINTHLNYAYKSIFVWPIQ